MDIVYGEKVATIAEKTGDKAKDLALAINEFEKQRKSGWGMALLPQLCEYYGVTREELLHSVTESQAARWWGNQVL